MPASQFLRGAQERAPRPVTRLWYLLDITEHPLLLLLVRLGPGTQPPPLPLQLLALPLKLPQVLLWSTEVLHQATQVRLDKLLVTFDLVHTISPAPRTTSQKCRKSYSSTRYLRSRAASQLPLQDPARSHPTPATSPGIAGSVWQARYGHHEQPRCGNERENTPPMVVDQRIRSTNSISEANLLPQDISILAKA